MPISNERRTGVRYFLSRPKIYDFFQFLIGGRSARKYVISRFVSEKNSILDIGCGTGYALDFIPQTCSYEGFDLNKIYINYARNKYGQRGKFYCQNAGKSNIPIENKYDIVLAMGLIHHLNDVEADNFFKFSSHVLKPSGKLLTLDGVYEKGQNPVAKFMLNNDRGKYIRFKEAYLELAQRHFDHVSSEVNCNLFKIPYSCCILNCSN